jgi:hypothetical protein
MSLTSQIRYYTPKVNYVFRVSAAWHDRRESLVRREWPYEDWGGRKGCADADPGLFRPVFGFELWYAVGFAGPFNGLKKIATRRFSDSVKYPF